MSRTYLDTFTGKENLTIAELNLKVDLIIETKEPSEIFEDYDPLKISLLINIWDDRFGSVDAIEEPLPELAK